jgi:hypothetical protein
VVLLGDRIYQTLFIVWDIHHARQIRMFGYELRLKNDGFHYYEYVLVYVDDLLVQSHQGEKTMKSLEEFYRLKDGFAQPTRYLGAEIKQWTFLNDASRIKWALSSTQYIKEAVKNIKSHFCQYKIVNCSQPVNLCIPIITQNWTLHHI